MGTFLVNSRTRLGLLSVVLLIVLISFHGVSSKPTEGQGQGQGQKVKLKVKVRISPGPATITKSRNSYAQNNGISNAWGPSQGSPSSSEKLYILRRKKGHKSKSSGSLNLNSYESQSASHPQNSNNVDPDPWVMSLHDAYTSSKSTNHYSSPPKKTPVMVDPPSNPDFRSNIPLPRNPFMPSQLQPNQIHPHFANKQFHKHLLPHQGQSQGHQGQKPNSRADTFLSSLTSLTSYMNDALPKIPSAIGQWAKNALSSSSSHYTKPGSTSTSESAPTVHVVDPKLPSPVTPPSPQVTASSLRQASFDSLLSKLHRLEEIKASLPPRGSYTPYGERTIIMVKFPGLPSRKRVISSSPSTSSLSSLGFSLGGIKPVSITVDDWNTPSTHPVKLKDSDVGVIISQNYILQPDVSMNSHYKFERFHDPVQGHEGQEDATNPSSDMVTLLAKALAERNRLINTYARKAANGGMSSAPAPEPPFVLVHLETFTKKKNNTTPFGFVEEIESSYANGTIIYPTLDDPGILASTKFEFEGIGDVEDVFNRPLQGYKGGVGAGMKPIVPLGLVEIQNYLRLMYQVHKDIHEGGRAKVGGLANLAHSVERSPLPGSRPMDQWEVDQRVDSKYRENWLHTSTMGLRSISDYPQPPPKLPIPYPT